jgi:LPXTG-motif cell wall-anchored protein
MATFQAVFLHYGGADENAPLLFVVGVGVLVGLFLAWRRGRRDE